MTRFYKNKDTSRPTSTVMFKYTEQEHNKINGMFRLHLDRIAKNDFNQTDWFNIAFRTKSALILAIDHCEDITIHELNKCYDICENMAARRMVEGHVIWFAREDEIEWLIAATEAIESLQRTVGRRVFNNACAEANRYLLKKYVYCKDVIYR